MLLKSLFLV
ncbi:rCG49100 [Rattus norvegicus]|uniref:RCG49100 n=1 Tax=Rattus norvegicus TaxID=10116 RepID=A6IGP5_RAT|nr:rCG49100 [Rattus norvegicus]